MSKKILFSAIVSLISFVCFTSCEEERTVYSGQQYIMFADTLSVIGVEDNGEYADIYISATKAMDKDQTLAGMSPRRRSSVGSACIST